jgi:hypothetical protein
MMTDDPEWSRKVSMINLVIGKISSLIVLMFLFKRFILLFIFGESFNTKDKDLILTILVLLFLWLFQDINMVIGAFSRFDGPDINLPYLSSLNGVGLSGILLMPTLLFSKAKNKNKNNDRLNVSLLPSLFLLTALVSTKSVILTIIFFILIIAIVVLVYIWSRNEFGDN